MQRKKISAVWVNKPKQQETEQNISQDNKEMPNFDAMERSLIERTFGTAIQAAEQAEPSLPIKEHKITVKDEG